jgi:hypothetical protein
MSIPFHGPSSRDAWTGGIPPNTTFAINAPEFDVSVLPAGKTWSYYDMGNDMNIRPAGRMTIPEWASMRYWEKNQFGLLYALSARVPDFSIASYWSEEGREEHELCIVIKKEESTHVEVATGPSKTKVKQAAALAIIQSASIWGWINSKYQSTYCDQYLQA